MKKQATVFALLTSVIYNFNALFAQTINILDAGFQPNNVLRYDLSYNTSEPTISFAEYYHLENGSPKTKRTAITQNAFDHQTTLIGLLPETEYHYRITAFNETGKFHNDWTAFTTQALPVNVTQYTSEVLPNDTTPITYSLTNDLEIPGISQTLLIVDNRARVVWYEPIPTTLGCFNISPQNTIIYTELVDNTLTSPEFNKVIELHLNGKRLLEFGNNRLMHHEIAYSPSGEIYALATDVRTIDRSSIGGLPDQTVVGDPIIVMDTLGNVIWEWTPFDVLDPLVYIGAPGFWDAAYGTNTEDWLHSNALYKDLDGNYLVSMQAHNQIMKVSATSGGIMWIMGEGGNINLPDSSKFIGQHGIYATSENTYMLFDNGGIGRTYSRVQEIEVNPNTMSAETIWQYNLPQNLFSFAASNAYRLPNGNVLICSGFPGYIFEITPEGETVWQISSNGSQYRAYHIPHLYEPLPELSFGPPAGSALCQNDAPLQLSALPDGGWFTGPGVENGTFDPSLAGGGTHTVTYHFAWDSIQQTIEVAPTPDLEIPQIAGNYCTGDEAQPLQTGPNGATFTVNTEPLTEFDPAYIGPGFHQAIYEYTDGQGCFHTSSQDIIINVSPDLPAIELANDTLFTAPQADLTYQWLLDGSPIAGAEEHFLLPQVTGNYSVAVTNLAECSASSDSLHVVVSGIGNTKPSLGWQIFPNPARTGGRVRVVCGSEQPGKASLRVYGTNGSLLAELTSPQQTTGGLVFEFSPTSGGLHLLQLQVGGQVEVKKLAVFNR